MDDCVYTLFSMALFSRARVSLPADFRDRPWYGRWWIHARVLLRRQRIKAVCCESFRNPEKYRACKGCPVLYDRQSRHWLYRFLARHGTHMPSPSVSDTRDGGA